MSSNHPEGLDESVLVGDGGRSWFRTQQKIQHEGEKNRNRHNRNQNKSISNKQNENTKLLSQQQRKRFKRQKKKQRKQNYNANNSTQNDKNNNTNNSSQNRSNFLYGNKNKTKDSDHPYTESATVQNTNNTNKRNNRKNTNRHNMNNKGTGFKTYIKSSNQEELNKISAQMLKAELLGNTEQYNTLQSKLNALREQSFIIEHRYLASIPKNNAKNNKNNNKNELFDEKGKKIELIMDSKISKKLHGLDDTMKEDDDINTLLRKERNKTSLDYDKSIFHNKNIQKIMNLDTDEQFDSISNANTNNICSNSRKRKRDIEKEQNKKSLKRARLISQHKHQTNWLNSCKFCIENEEIHNDNMSHLVIYYGKYMYLAVPKQECLVSYQCIIVPNMHLKSFRQGILNNDNIGASKDEQLQFEKELYHIQKILCKIFKTKCECGAVFIETVRNLKKNYHSIIHCYAIEFEQYNVCPVYFKKSILECDVMWNTNKKLIEITKHKALNKSIPHFMSYFYVQFGLFDGYAHIIEDETKIKQDFGAQIIAGIVGKVLFKIKNESYQKQIQRAKEFKMLFEPFKQKLDEKLKKIQNRNDIETTENKS